MPRAAGVAPGPGPLSLDALIWRKAKP